MARYTGRRQSRSAAPPCRKTSVEARNPVRGGRATHAQPHTNGALRRTAAHVGAPARLCRRVAVTSSRRLLRPSARDEAIPEILWRRSTVTDHRRRIKRLVLLVQREGYAHHLAAEDDRGIRLAETFSELRFEVGSPNRQGRCDPATVEEQPALLARSSFTELASATVLAGIVRPGSRPVWATAALHRTRSPRAPRAR